MKPAFPLLAAALLGCAAPLAARAGDLTFQSRDGQPARLVELYTSEGCSSCPPADAWLSRLAASPRLWTEIVPVAFHVDYWDRLGWRDRFASRANTDRQQSYAAAWGSPSVYTPGLVLDGQEWRGWSGSGADGPPARTGGKAGGAGQLTAVVRDGKTVTVTFRSATAADAAAPRQAAVALLGFGLTSRVKAGENQGRDLRHDFVALACERKALTPAKDGQGAAVFTLPAPSAADAKKLAVAVWVEEPGQTGVRQAVGGWLDAARP